MSTTRVAGVVCLTLLVATAAGVQAQDSARGLRGLTRVTLDVSLAPDVVDLRDEVEQRIELALREQQPAPALAREGADKLRAVVTVQAKNASELRGYWLPFSGVYALGYVRLEVERPLALPGSTASTAPVPAIVWQADRLVSASWRETETAIIGAVESLLGLFLEEYRRSRGR
jgi:hypothetical protein